jgi:hypothetical protein
MSQREWKPRRLYCAQFILLTLCCGCRPANVDDVGAQTEALNDYNGWNTNGWNTNGWNTNGWSTSSWQVNNGQLTGAAFLAGLGNGDVTYNTLTMGYLVACALASGDSISASVANQSFVWTGRLGLAPEWKTANLSPTGQRWISACMAAHFNRLGKHVAISLRGSSIGLDLDEATVANWQEAAFFGNLFDDSGLSTCAGSDNAKLAAVLTRLGRDCGEGNCPQMTFLNLCSSVCTGTASDGHWLQCAGHNEVITTYLGAADFRMLYILDHRPPVGDGRRAFSGADPSHARDPRRPLR